MILQSWIQNDDNDDDGAWLFVALVVAVVVVVVLLLYRVVPLKMSAILCTRAIYLVYPSWASKCAVRKDKRVCW